MKVRCIDDPTLFWNCHSGWVDEEKAPMDKLKELDVEDWKQWKEDEMNIKEEK